MLNEDRKGIGRYYFYSIVFHGILIGLIFYVGIKYKPQIQSIGSNVVVSVVSSVPGRLASIRSVMIPPKAPVKSPNVNKQPNENNKTKTAVHVPTEIPVVTNSPSAVYEKVPAIQRRPSPPRRIYRPSPSEPSAAPTVGQNVYNNLNSMVALNSAYNRIQGSLIRGNVHKFEHYVSIITAKIMSNFNINIERYLHYKAVAAFQISHSGRIYDIRIMTSSGSRYFDSQAIDALTLSSPLPPPPKNFMRYVNSKNAGAGALVNFNPKEMQK